MGKSTKIKKEEKVVKNGKVLRIIKNQPKYVVKPLNSLYYNNDFAFLSYSKDDSKYMLELRAYLQPIDINIFYDIEIETGEHWNGRITTALNDCKAGIILLSARFLASSYIRKKELKKLLQQARKRKVRLYIVYAGRCMHHIIGLDKFQFVNPASKPLNKLRPADREEVYNKLGNELSAFFKTFSK